MKAPLRVVVMGVSGCGKSEVGRRIAGALQLPLVEGDQFHPAANIEKMRQGVALTDEDRGGWLRELRDQLAKHADGAVLTCSALKSSYRNILRESDPALRFVHLQLSQDEALARVASRPGHFYPPSLVASQFATLEDPAGERGVLVLDATAPVDDVARQSVAWLRSPA